MTSKEWQEYFRDPMLGAAIRLDVTDVIRDLADSERIREAQAKDLGAYKNFYDSVKAILFKTKENEK